MSKINKEYAQLLWWELEYRIWSQVYDIKKNNYLIEVDPFAYHNVTRSPFNNPHTATYHQDKTKYAEANWYQCIHIFDWDQPAKIKMLLEPKEEIRLKKCTIKEVLPQEANRFLAQYHIQNGCRGATVCIALVHEDEIISVMTFGKSRYNKNYQREWLRYASKNKVHRALTAMRNYFIEKYQPESVVSYCDAGKFNGGMFEVLGFKLLRWSHPSLHWYNPKTQQHFTDNEVRRMGACRILQIPQEDRHINENGELVDNCFIMKREGFVEIYDAGQKTFIYNL